MINSYPEALNQHPFALDFLTVRHEFVLLVIWVPVAGVAFALTLWVLVIFKAFGSRVSLDIAIRASLRVGIAVFLFLPLYKLPFILFRRSSDLVATLGLCLDALVLFLGIISALRVIKGAQNALTSE